MSKSDFGFANVRSMFELKGKNFVVTGGGGGIGWGVVNAIAEMGGNVAVIDLLKCPVDDWQQARERFDVKMEYIEASVADEKSLTDAFGRAVSVLGGIDGCVTSAGINIDKPFIEHTWADAVQVMNVNFLGTFFSTQLSVKQMLKQGHGGSIVMISSVCTRLKPPSQFLAAYHGSKGAINSFCTALSVELAPHNIRTNTVSPGYVDTPMAERTKLANPHFAHLLHNTAPMKRPATPADLVGAVIYLLSDASTYTTGADILVTGGLHAGYL